ncbi:hypothetical protein KO317_01280 [Candidatus Micrarchaeota archaeon]|jgi:hypothetical protein|nr:hypothetical protein [Candidatus Micrarchaeota archaeon]
MKITDKKLLYIGLIPVVFLLLATILVLIAIFSPLFGLQENEFILILTPISFLLMLGGTITSPLFIIVLIRIYDHFKNKSKGR